MWDINTVFIALSVVRLVTALPIDDLAPPTRTFELGTVIGAATPVTSASETTTVYNYLGIPFAAAPTGSLRFAPPAAPTNLSRPLTATSFPPACIQQFSYPPASAAFSKRVFGNPGGPPLRESEDCLYLNVFAPTDASSENKKPVLFWIYGGDLSSGSGSVGAYNGSSFAGFQDVVVVTSNYRTNFFGFSNSPELPFGKQNAGYLDQRATLDWIQRNIASFGGDPQQVTIFGQSAGGYSVKQLLANPPSPLPFQAAILESEGLSNKKNGTDNYYNVALHFGCIDCASSLDCLRKVNSTDLINYIAQNAIGFNPVEDNITQSNDVRASIASHRWARVPYFLGSNADEATFILAESGIGPNSTVPAAVVLETTFGDPILVAKIQDAYAAYSASVNGSTYLLASKVLTDYAFTCRQNAITNYTRANGYEDSWRYYYNGTFPNEQPYPDPGAYHSSEIPQVFGTYSYVGPPTKHQEALSGYMQTAWASFAKDPQAGPGWAKLGSAEKDVADLGGINPVGATLISHNVPDNYCDVFKELLEQTGL